METRGKRKIPQRLWTEEEIAQLHELVEDHRDEEIAVLLNRTVDSVAGQRRAQGLKIQKLKKLDWTEAEDTQLRELLEGRRDEEIALLMHRTTSAIRSRRKSMGFKVGKPKWQV